jgi:succinate dehydrogenase hydrophobic anchor subunit
MNAVKEWLKQDVDPLLWVVHRISALALIFLLAIHFWLMHFKSPGEVVKFASVVTRLKNREFILVDLGLLTLTIFHGLNGISNILQDYGIFAAGGKKIGLILGILGCALAFLGGISLLRFM